MADANFAQSNNPKNSRRRRHLRNTRVDLTAMVDLGFLLITFFMLASTFNQTKVLSLFSQKQSDDSRFKPDDHKLISVLIGKSGTYYIQTLNHRGSDSYWTITDSVLNKFELFRLLETKLNFLKQKFQTDSVLEVVIKPVETSRYQSFIDLLEVINAHKIKNYTITRPDKSELAEMSR